MLFLISLAWLIVGFLLTIYLVKKENFIPGHSMEPPTLLIVILWPIFAITLSVTLLNKRLNKFLLSLRKEKEQ